MTKSVFGVFITVLLVVSCCNDLNAAEDNNSENVASDQPPQRTSQDNNHRNRHHRCDDLRMFHEELQWRRLKNLRDHILWSLNLSKPPPGNLSRPSDAMLEKIQSSTTSQMQSDSSSVMHNSVRTNKTPNNINNGGQFQRNSKHQIQLAEVRKKVIFSTKGTYVEFFDRKR